MNFKKQFLLLLLFMALIIFYASGCNSTSGAFFNNSDSSSSQQVSTTVLTYIIGSDLQCNNNLATKNIQEMQAVGSDLSLNIVVQTGGVGTVGCSNWNNGYWQGYTDVNRSIEYFGSQKIIQELGSASLLDMGKEQTLQEFIEWGLRSFNTDKYILVLWDHGGGINGGYGPDTNTSTVMSVSGLINAVKSGYEKTGKKFELIGFDACLMGMAEIASGLAPYAKYLVASEETEPGAGWNYTAFLQYAKNNPNASGAEIGKVIVDSFIEKCKTHAEYSAATLSVIDLSKIADLVTTINNLSLNLSAYVQTSVDNWIQIAAIRWTSLDFSSFILPAALNTSYQYVDLIYFMEKLVAQQTSDAIKQSASDVLAIAKQAVIYSSSNNLNDAKGISIYFPSSMQDFSEGVYSEKTRLNNKTFFASNYSDTQGLIDKYYHFFATNQSSLLATVGQGQTVANTVTWNTTGTIIDSTLYLSSVDGVLYSSQDVSISNNTITFKKSQSEQQYSNWDTINGIPVLLFSSPNMTQTSGGIDYIIPVVASDGANPQNCYLAVRAVDSNTNIVVGLIMDSFLTGKVVDLEKNLIIYPKYLNTNTNSFVYNESFFFTVGDSGGLTVAKSSLSSASYSGLDYIKGGAIGITGDFVLSSNVVKFR